MAQKQRVTLGEPFTPNVSIVRRDSVIKESQTNWFSIIDSQSPLSSSIIISSNLVLSSGGRRCLETPNAGGNSVWSEVLSFEILKSSYDAELLRTEMEIEYRCGSKITDFSVMIRGEHLGVSVTRAMAFGNKVFDLKEAKRLLKKKLGGVRASTRGVIKAHRWKRQILHILTPSEDMKSTLLEAYGLLRQKVKSDTIILITVTHGQIDFIYSNRKK